MATKLRTQADAMLPRRVLCPLVLFLSSILLIWEARLATAAVIDEMQFITTLGQRLAPADWTSVRGDSR